MFKGLTAKRFGAVLATVFAAVALTVGGGAIAHAESVTSDWRQVNGGDFVLHVDGNSDEEFTYEFHIQNGWWPDATERVTLTRNGASDGANLSNGRFTATVKGGTDLIIHSAGGAGSVLGNRRFEVTEVSRPDKYTSTEFETVRSWDVGGASDALINVWHASKIDIKATKTLQGATLQAGQFKFQLLDSNGNAIATTTNAADGSVVFKDIEVPGKPGEYTFSIREVLPDGATAGADSTFTVGDNTYSYSGTAQTVKVKVSQTSTTTGSNTSSDVPGTYNKRISYDNVRLGDVYSRKAASDAAEKWIKNTNGELEVVYCINRGISSETSSAAARMRNGVDPLANPNLVGAKGAFPTWLDYGLDANRDKNTAYGAPSPSGVFYGSSYTTNQVPSGADALAKINRVLYNGYPVNASGLNASYESTQRAIWAVCHYGNGDGSDKGLGSATFLGSDNMAWALYNYAIGRTATSANPEKNATVLGYQDKMKNPPANYKTNMYYTGSTSYQNMIGTWFSYDDERSVTTTSTTIEQLSTPAFANTLQQPATTEVSITKRWNDSNNRDALRPTAASFKQLLVLKAGGQDVTSQHAGKLTVTDNGNGTFTAKWTDLPELSNGQVYTVEEKAISGYEADVASVRHGGTITNTHVPNPDVTISKRALTGSAELPGASLVVRDANNNVVDRWTSGDTPHTVQLAAGTYTLTEVTAPDGYEVAETITFTVDANGLVAGSGVESGILVMRDKPEDKVVEVKVSKVEMGGSEELPGAELIIRDSNNKIVESWTSGSQPKTVQLYPGTYTLTEVVAPDGYDKAETITFIVGEDGKVVDHADNTVVMEDKKTPTPHEVEISKVDATSKQEIEGAQLIIRDSSNKIVDSWTSDGQAAHKVQLPAGTYTLTEVIAPDGYDKTETITFVVGEDGKVDNSGGNKVVMEDTRTPEAPDNPVIKVSKVALGGTTELPGASLIIEEVPADGSAGKIVDNWTSGSTEHQVQLAPGKYKLTELSAPAGYEKAESVEFEVLDLDGTLKVAGADAAKVTMQDKPIPDKPIVKISKTDVNGTDELPGAQLIIRGADGKVVDSWTSGTEVHEVQLEPGTYTLTEITAPDGYQVAESIGFTVNANGLVAGTGVENGVLRMKDAPVPTIEISKVEMGGTAELVGAELVIRDSSNKVVASWTSTSEPHKVALPEGTYTLIELTAPQGYETAEAVGFAIGADGKLDPSGETKVVMEDKPSSENPLVEISKVEAGGSDELPGAELIIRDADGSIVDNWTSGEETHKVRLEPGTYTLTEVTAPNGYEKAETITFTVGEDGKVAVGGENVAKVVMEDQPTSENPLVKVSKVEMDGSDELPGAELIIRDKDGSIVESWTSGDAPHEVRLAPGDYTLTEITAPDGYEKAETVGFKVLEDGNVAGGAVKNGVVVMEDKPTSDNPQVEISKVEVGGTAELPGAELIIRDASNTIVDNWTSTTESHKVRLAPGSYTLTEVTAPNGYEKAETISFTVVDMDGKLTVAGEDATKVVMEDVPSDENPFVKISKVDATNATAELPGAELIIRDSDNKVVDSWTSTTSIHEVQLAPGTYTLTEVTAPDGYEKAETITFEVNEDGLVGSEKVVMEDAPSGDNPQVEISKVEVGGTDELPGAELIIRNADGSIVDSWTSGTEIHKVRLAPGDYTLTEITAPNGYEKAETIGFTVVDMDGKLTVAGEDATKVVMEDAPTPETPEYKILKTGEDGTTPLAGAELVIRNEAGKVVHSWRTGTEAETVALEPGNYTLTELTVPDGYEKAADVAFVVTNDGQLQMGGNAVEQVVMVDVPTPEAPKVKIIKLAQGEEENTPLAGAQLVIRNKDTGAIVESWISTTSVREVELPAGAGRYSLEELQAPEGYTKAASIDITVGEDGSITSTFNASAVIEVLNVPEEEEPEGFDVSIDKKGEDGSLAGAELAVYSGSDIVENWVSDGTVHTFKLDAGIYTLREIAAPEGYEKADDISFTVDSDGKVTVEGEEVQSVVMTDSKKPEYKVAVLKVDENDAAMSGVKLLLEGPAGFGQSITSGTAAVMVTLPSAGTYTLTEIAAPAGYQLADPIAFTVGADGTVTSTSSEAVSEEAGVFQVKMANVPEEEEPENPTIKISKVAQGETAELAGARLIVENETGDVVASWTTGAEQHELQLAPGNYKLVELVAPEGYDKAADINFTVAENGLVDVAGNVLVMQDKQTDDGKKDVEISKTTINGTDELPGAKLIVENADGDVVASWTSGTEPHKVRLEAGTYTLTEITAPDGYEVAESITFTVKTDGTVESAAEGAADGNKVVMKDAEMEEPDVPEYIIKVKKVDEDGEALPGAKLLLEGPDSFGQSITSTDAPIEVKVPATGSYTLTEITAPAGYQLADTVSFEVAYDEQTKVTTVTIDGEEQDAATVTMTDVLEPEKPGNPTIQISKRDINGTDELEGARLIIEDADGKVVESWTSGSEAHSVTLPAGKYTLTEITAPDGFEVAESIKFEVNEDGLVDSDAVESGVLVMKDEQTPEPDVPEYLIKVKKENEDGEALPGAKLLLEGPDGFGQSITTTAEAIEVKVPAADAEGKEYTLTEISAPAGYELAAPIAFTVKYDADEKKTTVESSVAGAVDADAITVVMTDKKAPEVKKPKVSVLKVDEDGAALAGARLIVEDAANKVVANITSTTEAAELELDAGTYKLSELAAPEGYELAETITFVVAFDAATDTTTVTVDGEEVDAATVTMTDKKQPEPEPGPTAKVRKVSSAYGQPLAGARLIVENAAGVVVDSWTSEEADHETPELEPGTYTLTEITAPDGYAQAAPITFKIADDGTVSIDGATAPDQETLDAMDEAQQQEAKLLPSLEEGVIVMKDKVESDKPEVEISKVDITDEAELPGAQLIVRDEDGNIVASWVSAEEPHKIRLDHGTYTLTEITAPDGYEVAEDVTFTVDPAITSIGWAVTHVVMKDAPEKEPTQVTLAKVDENGNSVDGARLLIEDEAGDVVESWTSGNAFHVAKLAAGSYKLVELATPAPYAPAADINFTVGYDGKLTVNGEAASSATIFMVDVTLPEDNQVSFTKIASDTGAALQGVRLIVEDEAGNIVAQWTSTSGVHVVPLAAGNYTLSEVVAPDGYQTTDPISFTVRADGTVLVDGVSSTVVGNPGITMVDEPTPPEPEYPEVKLAKLGSDTGSLPGARLMLEDANGKVVDSWTSERTPHTIKLPAGEYVMTELTAPAGYELAAAVRFTVDAEGKITVNGEAVEQVEMVDQSTPENPEIEISKVIAGGTQELPGAELIIRDKDGKIVDHWVTEATSHKTKLLGPGTYTLTEVIAPEGYQRADSISFTVDANGLVNMDKLVMEDAEEPEPEPEPEAPEIEVSKVAVGGSEELPGATLMITPADDPNTVIAGWNTTNEPKKVALEAGTYMLIEAVAPEGYELAEPITFTVDAEGNITIDGEAADSVVMRDAKTPVEPEVAVLKVDADTGEPISGATLTIRQKDGDGTVLYTWLTNGTDYKVKLGQGTYLLTEAASPEGYELADTIEFAIDADGILTIDGAEAEKVVMKDKPQSTNPTVEISKVDATTSNELPGAMLWIRNEAGQTVDTWVSGTETHKVQLAPGTYTLTEITAPAGYDVAETITFTVNEDGLVDGDKVVMEDKPKPVTPAKDPGELATTIEVVGYSAPAGYYLKLENDAVNGVDTVVDRIRYTNLEPNATYFVTGKLMKVVAGVATEVASEEMIEFSTSRSGNGTWTMTFSGLTIEPDTLYVVLEEAVRYDDDVTKTEEVERVTHANVNDRAQTVSIGNGDEYSEIITEDDRPYTPSTEEEDNNKGGDSKTTDNDKKSTSTTTQSNQPTTIAGRLMSKTGDAGAFAVAGLTACMAIAAATAAFSLRRRRKVAEEATREYEDFTY